ncbi:MAG: helix-turn-helix transcriptional regulator [Eubacteriales bacterium]|nr:helix-turn-helix transcriptional regulator [Eubacteriales bacterium]
MTMDKESFGAALAEHRKKQGMTQRQLADKLNVTDKAVSKWERGLSYPDVTLLEPLADALSVSVETLLRCEGPAPIRKDETMQEEQKQQEPIQNLVELSSENLKRERRRSKKWIAAVAAILIVVTIAGNLYYRAEQKHIHRVENMGTVMLVEKDGTDTYLYVESLDREHMLKLKGTEDFDRSARLQMHGLRSDDGFTMQVRTSDSLPYYRMVYDWDDRTYEGTISECSGVVAYYAWEDLYGADCKIDKQHTDGVKLDAPLWHYDETYCMTSENTIRFYTYLPELDQYYRNDLNVGRPWRVASFRKDEVIDWQSIDCDCDGELELIVHTRWSETPYALYDEPWGRVTQFLSEAEYLKLTAE